MAAQEFYMKISGKFHMPLVAVTFAVTLSACPSGNLLKPEVKPTEQVAKMEETLAGVGFEAHYATTSKTFAAIKSLPQHTLGLNRYQNQYRYVYADAELCGCVFIGNRIAYQRYREMLMQQGNFDLQIEATELTDPLPSDWTDWGPWYDAAY
jgi:hypothetical protein